MTEISHLDTLAPGECAIIAPGSVVECGSSFGVEGRCLEERWATGFRCNFKTRDEPPPVVAALFADPSVLAVGQHADNGFRFVWFRWYRDMRAWYDGGRGYAGSAYPGHRIAYRRVPSAD